MRPLSNKIASITTGFSPILSTLANFSPLFGSLIYAGPLMIATQFFDMYDSWVRAHQHRKSEKALFSEKAYTIFIAALSTLSFIGIAAGAISTLLALSTSLSHILLWTLVGGMGLNAITHFANAIYIISKASNLKNASSAQISTNNLTNQALIKATKELVKGFGMGLAAGLLGAIAAVGFKAITIIGLAALTAPIVVIGAGLVAYQGYEVYQERKSKQANEVRETQAIVQANPHSPTRSNLPIPHFSLSSVSLIFKNLCCNFSTPSQAAPEENINSGSTPIQSSNPASQSEPTSHIEASDSSGASLRGSSGASTPPNDDSKIEKSSSLRP